MTKSRFRRGDTRGRIGLEARRTRPGFERLVGRQVGIDRQARRRRQPLVRRGLLLLRSDGRRPSRLLRAACCGTGCAAACGCNRRRRQLRRGIGAIAGGGPAAALRLRFDGDRARRACRPAEVSRTRAASCTAPAATRLAGSTDFEFDLGSTSCIGRRSPSQDADGAAARLVGSTQELLNAAFRRRSKYQKRGGKFSRLH